MSLPIPRILYVDNEEESCLSFKAVFRRSYTVVTTCQPLAVSALIEAEDINLIMSDFTMPIINGTTLLKFVRTAYPEIKRIIVTGSINKELEEKIKVLDIAHGCINKPWTKEQMEKTIKDVFYI